jgi:gliding motility-associated-like protein
MNNQMKRMIMNFKMTYFHLLIVLILLVNVTSSIAQTKSYGNTIVENNGDMKIYDALSFRINFKNKSEGIIGTERGLNKSYISFMPGASWSGANNSAFIDGYARTLQSNPFIFPIGDNLNYRPAKVTVSSKSNPTDAAYFGVNPSIAITSPFFGNTNTILPLGGPFNSNQKDPKISAISTKEYWDINGTTPAKISLSWDANSGLASLLKGSLTNLIIVGWDGSKWVKINSEVDITSIYGFNSTITIGSATTLAPIVPNAYAVYTLACMIPDKVSVFSSNLVSKLILQNQSFVTTLPINSNISDTNLIVTITHSSSNYGLVSNANSSSYKYTADNNFIGIDTVISSAKIYNKPSATFVYDTFINEILVRYSKADTAVDMGTSNSITIGKLFNRPQNIGYSYGFKSKYGTMSSYSNGKFKYQTNFVNKTDTLFYYFNVDYLGIMMAKDTTRYIIKLANGINSISSLLNDEYKIQNYLTPNGDGSNDNWILPKELTDKYPKINVSISNMDGKVIYQNEQYQNDWPPREGLPTGTYLYQIYLDTDTEIKGILRVNNQ